MIPSSDDGEEDRDRPWILELERYVDKNNLMLCCRRVNFSKNSMH